LVNKLIIQKRLRKLSEYVKLLKLLQKEKKEKFINDPFVYGNVERYLQLAIQSVIDISNHILSEHNINGISDYRDVIEKMGQEKFLPLEFAKHIAPMAGLRNILVHEYIEVEREKLYEILENYINDFNEFGKYITKML